MSSTKNACYSISKFNCQVLLFVSEKVKKKDNVDTWTLRNVSCTPTKFFTLLRKYGNDRTRRMCINCAVRYPVGTLIDKALGISRPIRLLSDRIDSI
ncbi:hypothetical protein GJ496_008306 [Pomphorhynchus laevis]|nr:hypothetical protein GJ496_008306 [Pomphorhynchus laevis]